MAQLPKNPPGIDSPIDPLRLKEVNRIRDRIAAALGKAAIVVAVSAGAGAGTGSYVQDKYREITDYSPEETAETEESGPQQQPSAQEEKKEPPKDEKWWDRKKREAKEKIGKLKKKVNEETGKKVETLPAIREYHETVRELRELKRKALETGDKIAFWLPFILTFLAAIKLARLLMAANQSIRKLIDPERSKKLDATEKKINEMIERLNALSAKQADAALPAGTKQELEALEDDFQEVSGIIDKAALKIS